MRLDCEDVRLELAGLVSGELDETTTGLVRAHISGCHGCARELAEIGSTITVLRDAPLQDEPGTDLEPRVLELATLESVG